MCICQGITNKIANPSARWSLAVVYSSKHGCHKNNPKTYISVWTFNNRPDLHLELLAAFCVLPLDNNKSYEEKRFVSFGVGLAISCTVFAAHINLPVPKCGKYMFSEEAFMALTP